MKVTNVISRPWVEGIYITDYSLDTCGYRFHPQLRQINGEHYLYNDVDECWRCSSQVCGNSWHLTVFKVLHPVDTPTDATAFFNIAKVNRHGSVSETTIHNVEAVSCG